MKKIALFLTAIALTCANANAQSLLERLGQRAKNAAENNVGNKVEQGVNDLLNGKLGKKRSVSCVLLFVRLLAAVFSDA